MNFIEAVAEMRKGKKIRRLTQHEYCRCYIEDGVVLFINGAMSMPTTFDMFKPDDYEATDWEVLEEDKEWNLADNMDKTHEGIATPLDVKKLRDLLIEDIKDVLIRYEKNIIHFNNGVIITLPQSLESMLLNKFNKRFGEL